MFVAFPIISIYNQYKVINKSIKKYNLSRAEVLMWLSVYGEISMPVGEDRLMLDYDNLDKFVSISFENRHHMFAYYSKFGFVNGSSIHTPNNQLAIFQSGWL